VVDERALVSALKKGKIGQPTRRFRKRAQTEPRPFEIGECSPSAPYRERHEGYREQMAVLAAKNAVAMARGKRPPNIVNPEVFESPEYKRRVSG